MNDGGYDCQPELSHGRRSAQRLIFHLLLTSFPISLSLLLMKQKRNSGFMWNPQNTLC